jgi:hypothetical protein
MNRSEVMLNVTYIREQLQSDPYHDAELILARRESLLQLEPSADAANKRTSELTRSVDETIKLVRSSFWQMSPQEISEKLATIDYRLFPETQVFADRLQRGAAAREEFSAITNELKGKRGLLDYIKLSIVATPLDLAGVKETVAREVMQLGSGRAHKRTVRLIKEKFPQIYQVDPAWLDSILKLHLPGGATVIGRAMQTKGVIIALLVIVVLLIRYLVEVL